MNALSHGGRNPNIIYRLKLIHALEEREHKTNPVTNESNPKPLFMALSAVPIMKEATTMFFNSTPEVNWERVAEDTNTTWQILELLANHSDPGVRAAVADNTNARPDTLLRLAHDPNPDVRYQLAENHNICREVLEILSEDENPYVRMRAEVTKRRATH